MGKGFSLVIICTPRIYDIYREFVGIIAIAPFDHLIVIKIEIERSYSMTVLIRQTIDFLLDFSTHTLLECVWKRGSPVATS